MPKALKASSQVAAKEYGFSSLQELVRVLLTKLSKRELVVSVSDRTSPLSPKNASRYRSMSQVLNHQADRFDSIDELMKDLRS